MAIVDEEIGNEEVQAEDGSIYIDPEYAQIRAMVKHLSPSLFNLVISFF